MPLHNAREEATDAGDTSRVYIRVCPQFHKRLAQIHDFTQRTNRRISWDIGNSLVSLKI